MSKLTGSGIIKKYGKKEALRGVDLELESGKIYGLIGRNGAGKTTLLSVLTAQSPVTEGSVLLDGQPVWENPRALARLYFSRELSLATSMNAGSMKVKEYLRIAEAYLPYWDGQMAQRLIRKFGLDVKQKIYRLSKGMQSMVMIITALASKAEFTFLDEPVTGLDAVARDRFYTILMEEFAETGRTFVISTHMMEEAAGLFEEVILVNQGQLLLKENTQELLDRSFHISGNEKEVDDAVRGLTVYHTERLGRSKGVTVMLEPGQHLPREYEISIQKPSLERLFVALCGEEQEDEA